MQTKRNLPMLHHQDGEIAPRGAARTVVPRAAVLRMAFTRYCHNQYCMVYGIHCMVWSGGRRILRNRRAIVLQ